MLLSHCPNCQHDNKPGERFCASCGVPLDLKPCPVCGKVDDVKATICTGCGAHFPPIVAGRYPDDTGVAPDTVPGRTIPPLVPPPPSPMRPLPLIIVAVAAAGIPMLWLYRNAMPVPKAWQPAQTSGVEAPAFPPMPIGPVPAPTKKTEAPPAAQPAVAEPAQPSPAPALIPLPPTVATPVAEAQRPAAAIVANPPAASAPSQKPADPPKAGAAVPRPSAPATARPVAKPAVRPAVTPAKPPPAAVSAPGSECTEALAAVGLCDPKTSK